MYLAAPFLPPLFFVPAFCYTKPRKHETTKKICLVFFVFSSFVFSCRQAIEEAPAYKSRLSNCQYATALAMTVAAPSTEKSSLELAWPVRIAAPAK